MLELRNKHALMYLELADLYCVVGEKVSFEFISEPKAWRRSAGGCLELVAERPLTSEIARFIRSAKQSAAGAGQQRRRP
jgi:hypothetical protein